MSDIPRCPRPVSYLTFSHVVLSERGGKSWHRWYQMFFCSFVVLALLPVLLKKLETISLLSKGRLKEFLIILKAFNGQREEKSKITFTFRMLLYGVKQFNLQPERGLKYLQENGFLENNPESVAQFLFRQERLSKKQIGECADSLSNVDVKSNPDIGDIELISTHCRQVSWKPLGIQQRSPAPLCPMPWIHPTFIGPSLEAVLVEFQVCNWS